MLARSGAENEISSAMPRGPRIDYPGAYHHVYARGIEKRRIFLDDSDRGVFLGRLGPNLSKWHLRCLAWALMPNHFHLLLISDSGDLPSFMRCLLTGYSVYFNERQKRVGHLFQNRYKSRVISKEAYLREVIRYIHLNPIRSGLVGTLKELGKYPWTGNWQIMGGDDSGWMDLGLLQEFFSGDGGLNWKIHYHTLMEEGYRLSGLGKRGETGIELSFIDSSESQENRPPLEVRPPDKFFAILAGVSAETGIPAGKILGRNRGYAEVHARRDVLRACRSEMKAPISHICRWLGITEGCGGYLLRSSGPSSGSSKERPGS